MQRKKVLLKKRYIVQKEKISIVKKAKVAASRYIEKMKSYPIRDEKMLENLIDGLFNIVYIGKGRVEGECTRTTYFRLILQKQSKKSKKV